MTNAHDWIDSDNDRNAKAEYGAKDMILGWVIYSLAVVYLIV